MNLLPTLFVALLAVAADAPDYTRQVKPLLTRHCVSCHGAEKHRGGLRLDSGSNIRAGGDSGAVVPPGKSAESLLIKAISGAEGVAVMPPKGPRLAAEEIALLRAWIDAGAVVPTEGAPVAPVVVKHWAFQPIGHPVVPQVKQVDWVRNPLDAFILARLEKAGIRPSPEADRVTLIRRLSLDLLGLPPTPGEIDAFVSDQRPDAYEKLVDRLLDSPHYGERWGRHWLDVARYADSNGYSIDGPRQIWKYRDWVIDALNRDLPFDRFAIEQIAGDLLAGATTEQKIATGFHRNTQINQEGGIDVEQFRIESVVDRANTTGTAFLGLTIGCAQCHDHKFDPLSQREYYRFLAFFNNVDEPTLDLATPEQARQRKEVQARIAGLLKLQQAVDSDLATRLEKWEGGLTPEARAALPEQVRKILAIAINGRSARQEMMLLTEFRNVDQTKQVVAGFATPFSLAFNMRVMMTRWHLDEEIAIWKAKLPDVPTTLVVQERTVPRITHLLLGGDFTRKGVVVTASTPAVLPPLPKKDHYNRLDLARWLVDGRNPLTARVVMNRFWQAYFGLGLVETENDFGTQGLPPSHPELLDWLARAFMERGWRMKALHKVIVTSATYRQSSKARADLKTVDPRNRLLARQNRLRLDAEIVRDVALAASGLLNDHVGGPGVYPPQPSGVYSFTQVPREWKVSTGADRYRRAMYTYFQRSAPHPALIVFDAPDGTATCTRRNRSNTPLQALTLLNDQGFFEFAQSLAVRTLKEAPSSDASRIRYAFRLCLGRDPQPRELDVLGKLLTKERAAYADKPEEAKRLAGANGAKDVDAAECGAWVTVARVLLNLDEFITRE